MPILAPAGIQADGILFGSKPIVRCIESDSKVFDIVRPKAQSD